MLLFLQVCKCAAHCNPLLDTHSVLCKCFCWKYVECEISFPLTIAVNQGRDLHVVLLRNKLALIRPLIRAVTCLWNIACNAGFLWNDALLPHYLGALFYISVETRSTNSCK